VPLKKPKSLFRIYNKDGRLLQATKNCNLQVWLKKDWWPLVGNIEVQHFDSLDELEDALAVANDSGNQKTFTQQMPVDLM
jgi:predicted proteasome-type protease